MPVTTAKNLAVTVLRASATAPCERVDHSGFSSSSTGRLGQVYLVLSFTSKRSSRATARPVPILFDLFLDDIDRDPDTCTPCSRAHRRARLADPPRSA